MGGTDARHTVRAGESLASIAAARWGDASLWYLLAQANGLAANAALAPGQSLIVPDKVISNTNNASTFRPYDAAQAMGDVSPTTTKPPKKPGCGVFGIILLAVIAIAVAAIAAPALIGTAATTLSGLGALGIPAVTITAGTGLAGALGAVGGAIVGGAIAGALGSAASQVFGLATGIQQGGFNWKAVGLAAISGAVGGGLSKVGSIPGIGNVANAAVRGTVASTVTQGIGVATGLQDRFSWAGVAGAGIGVGLAQQLGSGLAGLDSAGGNSLNNHLAHLGVSGASMLANAATRSILEGTDFGDNVLAALPDVIGQTVFDLARYGVVGKASRAGAGANLGATQIDAPGVTPSGKSISGEDTQIEVNQSAVDAAGDRVLESILTKVEEQYPLSVPYSVRMVGNDLAKGLPSGTTQNKRRAMAVGVITGTGGIAAGTPEAKAATEASVKFEKQSYQGPGGGVSDHEGISVVPIYDYDPDEDVIYYNATYQEADENGYLKYFRVVDQQKTDFMRAEHRKTDYFFGGFLAIPAVTAGGIAVAPGSLAGIALAGGADSATLGYFWRGVNGEQQSVGAVAKDGALGAIAGPVIGYGAKFASPYLNRTASWLGTKLWGGAAERGVAQVTLNRANGLAFEDAGIRGILSHVGLGKNTTAITRNGVTTILDASGRPAGLVEFKDVVSLSSSPQLRAQLAEALATRQPYNLVVSPGNQSISKPLIDQIREVNQSVGGGIYRYDPAADILTPWGK